MQKLPQPNLPASKADAGSYERLLSVKLNEILGMYRHRINTLIQNPDLPVHADNTAALAAGLVAGEFYRTSTGSVQVVY